MDRSFETGNFKTINLGLIYHSKALSQPPSRDTVPCKRRWSRNTNTELYTNHRQLVRYEKKGLESAFGTKKKHILKNN
jgi:hypothetical protein